MKIAVFKAWLKVQYLFLGITQCLKISMAVSLKWKTYNNYAQETDFFYYCFLTFFVWIVNNNWKKNIKFNNIPSIKVNAHFKSEPKTSSERNDTNFNMNEICTPDDAICCVSAARGLEANRPTRSHCDANFSTFGSNRWLGVRLS